MKAIQSPPVPRDAGDPIQYLLERNHSVVSLASAWGFRTSDSIYRLRRYDYVPPANTAQKMAATFGWTAGEVVDHWLERVQQRGKGR